MAADEVSAEPSAVKKKSDLPIRIVSAIVLLAVLAAALWYNDPWKMWLIVVAATICFVELVLLVVKATPNIPFRLAGILAGAAYIGVAALAMNYLPLHFFGAAVGAVVFTDVFAYFAGRAIGGPKIAPSISPSKTWAGLIGGMIGAGLFMIFFGMLFYGIQFGASTASELWDIGMEFWGELRMLAIIGAGLAVLAQMGDFLESWLKRKAGVKDSSRLIPGHGGVFDRIDGMLPVSIAVAALYNLSGMAA